MVNYMLQAGETRNPGELLATLAAQVPAHKETLMTMAEQLREEGRQEGRQEGRKEEKREVAGILLKMGLSPEVIEEVTGLNKEELTRLYH